MQSVSYFVLVNHWAFIFLSFPSSSSFLLSNRNVFFSSSCEDKGLPSRCLQATLPLMFLGKSLGSSCLALLGSVLNHSNPSFRSHTATFLVCRFPSRFVGDSIQNSHFKSFETRIKEFFEDVATGRDSLTPVSAHTLLTCRNWTRWGGRRANDDFGLKGRFWMAREWLKGNVGVITIILLCIHV